MKWTERRHVRQLVEAQPPRQAGLDEFGNLVDRPPAQSLRCGRARRFAMLQGDEPLREPVRQAVGLHVGNRPAVHARLPQHMRDAQHDRIARKRY